ncbi:acetylxylan esterase [Neobacillus drentensis]|uniref:acetylxylan esterase n=1 Tax=Neobacillus drentensis TaxID=220684 RepID=UPI0030002A4B
MLRQIGDFSLEELRKYKPNLTKQSDFDSFWYEMKNQASKPCIASLNWIPYPLKNIRVADVTIHSWDGTPLRAWLIIPTEVPKKIPALLHFHGYTDSRGHVHQYLKWALQGMAVISFEVRGQGFSPDYAKYPNGTQMQGWMTLGIEEKNSYYYANVYKDVLTCVNWAFSLEMIDTERIGVFGESQGGGLALVAAALEKRVRMVMSDFPFLAHFERSIKIASSPYTEILAYFKFKDPEMTNYDLILKNLSYFDVMNFAPEITCPALFCSGMEDNVTPPSSVFAVFNHLTSKDKFIKVYPEFGHELISPHEESKVQFVCQYLLDRE